VRLADRHTTSRRNEMKKIVIGIDGSETSQRALRWGVEEARIHDATVTVVHAWTGPAVATYALGAIPLDPGPFRDNAQRVLDEAIAGVAGVDPVKPVEAKLVEGGSSGAILEEARDADLVVVGSRGHGGFAGLLLGSVSGQVVHHATCPVVVVPAAAVR